MSTPRTPGIYRITNTVTGDFYIGRASDIGGRWATHKCRLRTGKHENQRLQRAWVKYGEDAFVFEVCELVNSKDALQEAEQRWLDSTGAGTRADCYNFASVSNAPATGRIVSVETRRKIAEAQRGKRPTIEARERMRQAKLGKVIPAEQRARMVSALKGKRYPQRSEEWKAQFRKLPPEDVVQLRVLRAEGASWTVLARRFGIGASTARRIVLGESYKGIGLL